MSQEMKGHVRLNIRFPSTLAKPINVIIHMRFPDILKND